MNRIVNIIITICLVTVFLRAQDFMIVNPYQLAVNNSTARLSNPKFSASSLSQAFFNDNYNLNFTLFLPYNSLTDANLRTSSFTLLTPSFSWGALGLNYAAFFAENLNDPVFDWHRIQLGYSNMLFNRIVFSVQPKWNSYTWYSDNFEDLTTSGFALDSDIIYIIDGYNSLGLSFSNLLATPFSENKNDRSLKTIKLGFLHAPANEMFDIEAGLSIAEDYLLKTQWGAFVNSELRLNEKFAFAAEYTHQFYNELGTAISYSFVFNNMHTQIMYGFHIDDSPFPLASFKHAFGINLDLNQLRIADSQVNPQLIYRDTNGPEINLKRLSDYNVFMNDNDSDFLELKMSARDDLSGLDWLKMQISLQGDSSQVLYSNSRDVNGHAFADTMRFLGYDDSGAFVENGIYRARIIASDNAGNTANSYFMPFRVLSHRNDSTGPDIRVEFDTSQVTLTKGEKDLLLNSEITIDEESKSKVRWTIHLFKTTNDSDWIAQKPLSGSSEIYNHNFQWLLRKGRSRSINGKYKLKIEAYDELNNYSMLWSGVKSIVDTVELQEEKEAAIVAEPEIVYLPDTKDEPTIQGVSERKYTIFLKAMLSYKARNIALSDFKFLPEGGVNPEANQQSLSIIGFYLQDSPGTEVTIETPEILESLQTFEDDIRQFFSEGFGIARQRVKFLKTKKDLLYFRIDERR